MTAQQLKHSFSLEPFSLFHALCTLVIILSAYTLANWQPIPQSPWLILSSILLSQAGLSAESKWKSAWPLLLYPSCGLIAALLILTLSLCASNFLWSSLLIIVITGTAACLGRIKSQFLVAAFMINILAIIAAFSPSDLIVAEERFYWVAVSGLLVFTIRTLYWLCCRPCSFFFARVTYFQKLKYVYQLIFYTPEHKPGLFGKELEETHFQIAWSDCLSAMQVLKKSLAPYPAYFCHSRESGNPVNLAQYLLSLLNSRFRGNDRTYPARNNLIAQLERLWDLTLSLGSLRYRLTEYAVFSMGQNELQELSQSIITILNELMYPRSACKSLSLEPLQKAIQEFEELYQAMLQTVSKEPLVILLFIQDLYALKEELEKLPQALQLIQTERGGKS